MMLFKKKRYLLLSLLIVITGSLLFFYKKGVEVRPPEIRDMQILGIEREKIGEDFYVADDSWLKRNRYGLWEMCICGDDFERGVKNGLLTKELIEYQEEAFVERIKEMVPSDFYLGVLKYFVAWFNRDIDEHIPIEYQKEIFGVSQFASDKFDFIAPNYHRILNYHAAHDIGHTLQNLNLVACTAFGVKDARSADSTLLIGRNMDFYSGDKFAENKIIAFYKPEQGYNFCFVTWGGLVGVISGMNDQGLVVALNAAESTIPTSAKTPVSILARIILQYAATVEEAYEIARSYETFVAESFLIASSKDRKIVVIEKSTEKTAFYERTDDELILTNHFQSDAFYEDEFSVTARNEGGSVYRWERTEELMQAVAQHDIFSFAAMLRDQKGKKGKGIGIGNEKSINQMIAHHSVIFKPEQRQLWVSVGPYQLGEYLSYDLNKVFKDSVDIQSALYDTSLTIPADSFLYSKEFSDYSKFKKMTNEIRRLTATDSLLLHKQMEDYIGLNPDFYYGYQVVGDYYEAIGDTLRANYFYRQALGKEIPRRSEAEQIKKKLNRNN